MVANSSTKDFRPISNNMTSSMRTHATPQQNGTAERKNRHILETSRALLLGAMVPSCHWGDVVATAMYLINRMPSKILHF
ncbi:Retrovirus-related Pol polyprotein from transposon TNT 1-94 [Vitis vinifera]|uniref:Retrovirus-related Pol polyprotein from transposon TNT 1-94 n=1 Tax=Vitis vinifera TaxID=29760 RepID=A0A438DHF0_VITVI|nr:Retrovirus-related Pol polyprotein from transposon TNT 1-94 [Vitis vinifera]